MRFRISRHPFLTAGLLSFALLAGLMLLEDARRAPVHAPLAAAWRVVGFGPHLAANLLARHAPGLPGWLDALLVIGLGLAPYLLLDFLLTRFRARRPASAASPSAAPVRSAAATGPVDTPPDRRSEGGTAARPASRGPSR